MDKTTFYLKWVFIVIMIVLCPLTFSHAAMIGNWSFDEGSGNSVYDSTGNFAPGSINGAQFTTGILNTGIVFSGWWPHGGTDYENYKIDDVTIPSKDIFYATGEITLSMWVSIADLDNSYSPFIFQKKPGGGTIQFAITPDDILEVAPSGASKSLYLNDLSINRWYYMALVLGSESALLYIDGVLTDEADFSGMSINDSPLIFGSNTITPDYYPWYVNPFSGIIDEVHLYDHALTQSQILEDMNMTIPGPATILLLGSGLIGLVVMRRKWGVPAIVD